MKVRSSLKSLKTRHRDCKVVRRKGVVGHQFFGNLLGERVVKATLHVDARQFPMLAMKICVQLRLLLGKRRFFSVCL